MFTPESLGISASIAKLSPSLAAQMVPLQPWIDRLAASSAMQLQSVTAAKIPGIADLVPVPTGAIAAAKLLNYAPASGISEALNRLASER
ncbi:hypothetical protein [Curtobacterium sp. RRHDQ10]|uniref:hypothetical protein n=1 Tax=Curtobacterium phyllosphaerae TaxID=3413379 RepID=UPI003BF160EB